MDFRDIESVLAIAKSGSWSDASIMTYQSMSSLSKRVKKVEKFLGVSLVERKPRSGQGILTGAGAEGIPLLEHMESLNSDILRYVHEVSSERTLRLVVGYPPLICSLGESGMMARFKHDWPNVDIVHVLRQKDDLVNMLISGDIDCAFALFVGKTGFNNRVANELIANDLNLIPMFSDYMMHVGVSENSPLARKESVTIQDLRDEVFLFNKIPEHRSEADISVRTLFSAALNGEVRYRLVDYVDKLTVVNMVISGAGVLPCACLPTRHIGHMKFIPIENIPIRSCGVLFYRAGSASFALKQFLKYAPDTANSGDMRGFQEH